MGVLPQKAKEPNGRETHPGGLLPYLCLTASWSAFQLPLLLLHLKIFSSQKHSKCKLQERRQKPVPIMHPVTLTCFLNYPHMGQPSPCPHLPSSSRRLRKGGSSPSIALILSSQMHFFLMCFSVLSITVVSESWVALENLCLKTALSLSSFERRVGVD